MVDMSVEFLGGQMDGKFLSPINEDELAKLGYRSKLRTRPHGRELITCIAVPINWSESEARLAFQKKFNMGSQRKPGKRSL